MVVRSSRAPGASFEFYALRGAHRRVFCSPEICYSTLAGVAIGIATITFMKMFATGTNLSIGVPFVRIGIVILASVLGIVFLKEGMNLKYLVGFLLSLAGLYLLITSK